MGTDTLSGGSRHAMAEWRNRQSAGWVAQTGWRTCGLCGGKGMIYSGDLMKPVGDGQKCGECGGLGRVDALRKVGDK